MDEEVTPLEIPPEIMKKMWEFFMERTIPKSLEEKLKNAEREELAQ